MNQVSTVGLDLAKYIFQLHGADSAGAVVFRKKLRRGQLPRMQAGSEEFLLELSPGVNINGLPAAFSPHLAGHLVHDSALRGASFLAGAQPSQPVRSDSRPDGIPQQAPYESRHADTRML